MGVQGLRSGQGIGSIFWLLKAFLAKGVSRLVAAQDGTGRTGPRRCSLAEENVCVGGEFPIPEGFQQKEAVSGFEQTDPSDLIPVL